MATFTIPAANWSDALSRALHQAVPGDTIIVRTEPAGRLARTAAERMGKTGLIITVASTP